MTENLQESLPLLQITDVHKQYVAGKSGILRRSTKMVHAVDGVSLDVYRGETLGLVGESGSGKSTLGRAMVRLDDVSSGEILFQGKDIASLNKKRLAPYRQRMQLIFQDPYRSLNPRRKVGDQLAEPLRTLPHYNAVMRQHRVEELIDLVGLHKSLLSRYPHEFSGGQRQRIGIARALALKPELIVADEPVSALDVSVQAQIVNLFADLRQMLGLTMVFIAHDLSIVRHISDRVAVMYLGSIVEIGATQRLFTKPLHPYTRALLSAIPVPSVDPTKRRQRILLKGEANQTIGKGCKFHPRCEFAAERCRIERPKLIRLSDASHVACHFPLTT